MPRLTAHAAHADFAKLGASTFYEVSDDDTLSSIAERFGVSEQDLASANGLRDARALRVGQMLQVNGL